MFFGVCTPDFSPTKWSIRSRMADIVVSMRGGPWVPVERARGGLGFPRKPELRTRERVVLHHDGSKYDSSTAKLHPCPRGPSCLFQDSSPRNSSIPSKPTMVGLLRLQPLPRKRTTPRIYGQTSCTALDDLDTNIYKLRQAP